MKKVLLALCVVLAFSAEAFAFGLPGIGSLTGGGGGGEVDKFLADVKEVTVSAASISDDFVASEASALEAFGNKAAAEKLIAEVNQIKSGNLSDKEKQEKIRALEEAAQKEINAKIEKKEALDAAGKASFSKSLGSLGKGMLKQTALILTTVKLGAQTVGIAKAAGPLKAAPVAMATGYLVYLNKDLPGNMSSCKKTCGLYMDYAKTQQVEVPSEISADMLN